MLQFYNLVGDKSQVYSIKAQVLFTNKITLLQKISLVANLGYEKKLQIMENSQLVFLQKMKSVDVKKLKSGKFSDLRLKL